MLESNDCIKVKFFLHFARSSLLSCILTGIVTLSRYLSKSQMISAFILILQLVQYNVLGKHYLVETEDENSLEENNPAQVMSTFYTWPDKSL